MKNILKIWSVGIIAFLLVGCGASGVSTKGTGAYSNSVYTSTVTKDIQSAVFGGSNSKIQLKIFSDYQCPACQKLHDRVETRLWKDYIDTGRVTATFYNFPLTFSHANAEGDALGALCALSGGKFREFRNEMYALEVNKPTSTTKITDTQRVEIAKKVGLPEWEFSQCLSEGWYQKTLEKEIKEGERLRISGTPAIYANDKMLNYQTPDEFFALLEALLK